MCYLWKLDDVEEETDDRAVVTYEDSTIYNHNYVMRRCQSYAWSFSVCTGRSGKSQSDPSDKFNLYSSKKNCKLF
jgi:hypothetical protein